MGNTYGYKPLSYELITLLRSGAPDFAAAEDLIQRGADVNDQGNDKGENVLSEILMGYWQSGTDDMAQEECWNCESSRNECAACEHNLNPNAGESMIRVIRFFLDHGFDVNRNEGRHGAQALNSLKPDLPDSSLKIGTFVYTAMRNLEAAGFSFTDDEIDQMCSSEWSKKIFHTNKPFMKRYTPGQTDNKGTDGYVRFKSEPYIFNGNQVLISKERFESQRKYFTEWYNSI